MRDFVWSVLNKHPSWHLKLQESPLLIQITWHSHPWAHVSEHGKRYFHKNYSSNNVHANWCSFLREHVFLSVFRKYPAWHLQMYQLPWLTHMCWQSCPRAHESKPEKKGNLNEFKFTDKQEFPFSPTAHIEALFCV